MDNITIIFLDIVGTFDSINNRDKLIKEFLFNLKKLKEKDKANKIIISFISTGTIDLILEYVSEIKEYINEDIILGEQFAYDKKMTNYSKPCIVNDYIRSKSEKIIDYIVDLEQIYNIKKLYYIDDSKMNVNMFIESKVDINYSCLIPGTFININNIIGSYSRGIEGINDCLNRIK